MDAVGGHSYVTKLSDAEGKVMCCIQASLHEHAMSGKKGGRGP